MEGIIRIEGVVSKSLNVPDPPFGSQGILCLLMKSFLAQDIAPLFGAWDMCWTKLT